LISSADVVAAQSTAVAAFASSLTTTKEMLEKLNRVYAGEPNREDRRVVAAFKSKLRSVLKDRS
jgi:hypothetical protein